MLEMQLHQENKKSSGGVYFIEELSNAQFTTYANLSSLCGISSGTLHNEGQGWLRFEMDGKELIVSKKTIRHSISWDQINNAGCVFGAKIVTIQGQQYKVRLLTGADHNPTQLPSPGYGYFLEGSHNSEWSRLFYPLITDDAYLNDQYTGPKDPRYTNLDLGMLYVDASTNGTYSWCQETHQENASYRVIRGLYGVSHLLRDTSSGTSAHYGWRPVLERL